MTTAVLIAGPRRIRAIVSDALPDRKTLVAALSAVLFASVCGLAGPYAIGQLTGLVSRGAARSALAWPVLLLICGVVGGAIGDLVGGRLLARVVLPAAASLRERTVAAALRLSPEAVHDAGHGDLVSRVSNDVERVSDVASGALDRFIAAAATILVTLVGLAALDWRFALAGLLAVPVQALTVRWFLRTVGPIYAASLHASGGRATAVLTAFGSLTTWRAYRLTDAQQCEVRGASERALAWELEATHASTRFYGRLNVAEFIGLGAILVVAFSLVHRHDGSIAAATTAALFFAGLFGPINTALGVFDDLQQASAALSRLAGVIDSDARIPSAVPVARGQVAAQIRVTGLGFGYAAGDSALDGIDLEMHPCEHLAVVGASGAGKSTLAQLLAGLRQPQEGSIQHHPDRRGRPVLITQRSHVFSGTVIDNLRFAAPQVTQAQASAVLDRVGADWVRALPNGLATLVGAGGATLTQAQAQQLALARVLLLDPPLVILDEATAEAGSDSARSLDRAAREVLTGRTGLVIAHRLNQAEDCDRILVMESGRIVESGTHKELLAAGGGYAQLWSAWAGGESDGSLVSQ